MVIVDVHHALHLKPAPETPDAPLPEPVEIRQVLFQNRDEYVETPVYQREELKAGQKLQGPCILEQMDTTLVVPQEWTIHVDGYGNLKIRDTEVK